MLSINLNRPSHFIDGHPNDVSLHTNPNVEYLIILMNGKPFKERLQFQNMLAEKKITVGNKIQKEFSSLKSCIVFVNGKHVQSSLSRQ